MIEKGVTPQAVGPQAWAFHYRSYHSGAKGDGGAAWLVNAGTERQQRSGAIVLFLIRAILGLAS